MPDKHLLTAFSTLRLNIFLHNILYTQLYPVMYTIHISVMYTVIYSTLCRIEYKEFKVVSLFSQ